MLYHALFVCGFRGMLPPVLIFLYEHHASLRSRERETVEAPRMGGEAVGAAALGRARLRQEKQRGTQKPNLVLLYYYYN